MWAFHLVLDKLGTNLSMIDELDDALEVPVGHVQQEHRVLPRAHILKKKREKITQISNYN